MEELRLIFCCLCVYNFISSTYSCSCNISGEPFSGHIWIEDGSTIDVSDRKIVSWWFFSSAKKIQKPNQNLQRCYFTAFVFIVKLLLTICCGFQLAQEVGVGFFSQRTPPCSTIWWSPCHTQDWEPVWQLGSWAPGLWVFSCYGWESSFSKGRLPRLQPKERR